MIGRTTRARAMAGLGVAVGSLALAAILATTAARASSTLRLGFHGDAFGTSAMVGSDVTSGPSFQVVSTCGGKLGTTWRNTGASANVPGAVTTATIDNVVAAKQTKAGQTVRSSSTTHSVDLLKGTITAKAVDAVSQITLTPGGAFKLADGSSFVHLVIGGKPTPVSANKKVTIPGVGYAILDERKGHSTKQLAVQTVNMIHLHVTVASNPYGLSPGANIVVGHATAEISKPLVGMVDGVAYGSRLDVGTTVGSGPSAPAYIPCLRGSSQNETAAVTLPSVGSTGATVNNAAWKRDGSTTSATTESSVAGVNLLKGMVTAKTLDAQLAGTRGGGKYSFSTHATVAKLVVNGKAVSVKPNEKIPLNGIGTLYIDRVSHTKRAETVTMLELVVSKKNSLGVPVGTDLRVGVAKIAFKR